ncbi:hypothetical protein Lo5R7ANS_33 [Mesorhizobium phage vB_MloP_Lo5R7ANS]|uniref:Poly A polymerase head domain-containing protein n=1 Tax=Mesorhizobium phage vB_MloP_Lo5R7ANS TaxID=1527771 RepID=A0A076YJ44_9CAUD|nr:nucleotidyltransferase [Mesorhizobium phage vB_MloP_Lo5R7ANS]AIK68503.1 hypothetical protein Lo5R7ANS_33 [Mesorhizobium phage vB_MloP_Lo5R7ANS]
MNQFLQVLTRFEELGGKGIVYGGCLRDTICGVGPIKDIDIAVENTPESIAAIDAYAAGDEFHSKTEQYIGYGNFPDVYKSVQVERFYGPTINFVVVSRDFPFTKKDVAERCDFGICQVALDHEGEYRSAAFRKDRLSYTFTYLREPFDEAQYQRSLRRWERLREKFEGWRLEVPGRQLTGTRADMIILDELFA